MQNYVVAAETQRISTNCS